MTAVLLLNANMEPLKTVSLQRAISLISKERVNVIESIEGKFLRSPSVSWPFPSVIRLRTYHDVPRRNATWSRKAVFARDGYRCVYCGTKVTRETATLDHIIPKTECKRLGVPASTWGNSACSCEKCNLRKGSKTMRDAGMKFFDNGFIAKTPRANYAVISGDVPVSWKVYLEG